MKKRSGIVAWLVAILWLAAYEWFALATGHQSLSRAAWEATQAWPPLIFIAGIVVGGLAVHLWWRWEPNTTDKGA